MLLRIFDLVFNFPFGLLALSFRNYLIVKELKMLSILGALVNLMKFFAM